MNPRKDRLEFDADFESGSMDRMLRLGANWYHLFLAPTEYKFFYFRVRGCKGREIIFEFTRPEATAFLECPMSAKRASGMPEPAGPKPVVSYDGRTWDPVERMEKDPRFPRLYRFVHTFKKDEAYLCQTHPYTYSDMLAWLKTIKKNPLVKIETLGKSRNGVSEPVLTIPRNGAGKELMVLIAREDSDEIPVSWGIEGVVRRLLASESGELLQRHTFKIVPMVSVDGVIAGATHSAGYGYGGWRWHEEPAPAEIQNVKHALSEWVAQGYRLKLTGKLHCGWSCFAETQEGALTGQDMITMNPALNDALRRYTDEYWSGTPARVEIRPRGFFERYVLDTFGLREVFGTDIQATTPENARRCGETLMKNIGAWLSET